MNGLYWDGNSTYVEGFKGQSIDAFGKLRTSRCESLFDWNFRYSTGYNNQWSNSTATGGTTAHVSSTASINILTTTTSGSTAIIQSRRYIEYYPGQGQIGVFSFLMNNMVSGRRSRIGLFDSDNGAYLEINGTTISVCYRSDLSGSVVNTSVSQSSWNIDKMDGSGISEINLDLSKHNVLVIDFSWLGSNTIRFGFQKNGVVNYVHKFDISNTISEKWSRSGCLPLRAESVNTGTVASSGGIVLSCVSVSTEGPRTPIGQLKSSDVGATDITVTTTEAILAAFRKNSSYPYAGIKPNQFFIGATSGNSTIYWRFILNPTITGPTWTAKSDSIADELTASSSFSGGSQLDSGYVNVGSGILMNDFKNDMILSHDLAGVSDILALTVRTLSSTSKVVFSGNWREFR